MFVSIQTQPFLHIRIQFLLVLLFLTVQSLVLGHPDQFRQRNGKNWGLTEAPINGTTFPRGLVPILMPKNHSHKLPLKNVELTDGDWIAPTNIFRKEPNVLQVGLEQYLQTSLTCSGCRAGIYYLSSQLSRLKDKESAQAILDICRILNLSTIEVCKGLIRKFWPSLKFIFNRANFDVNEFCAIALLNDDCMVSGKSMNEEWEVKLPATLKPRPKTVQLPKENSPSFKVLHLTDTHHDPFYTEGANAECKEPLCCRDKSQTVLKESDGAGKWGDYRYCDPPKATIDSMLDHIVRVHPDIDYVIWTGDLQPHNIWSETKDENVKLLREMAATMRKAFPKIPVFAAIGNHEASPASSFPQPFVTDPQFSNQWLLDEIDILWRHWLPKNVSPTIKYGGFYSVSVRPGFRIISINTNYCYSMNFWLLINATDPASHLQWLVYELTAAELSNEKVHIIGHIPPGYVDCMRIWSRNYFKIIGRFESTVTGQFFGHTHGDEIQIYWDPDDLTKKTRSNENLDYLPLGIDLDPSKLIDFFKGRPINVAYIAPSVSPFFDFNPGYKIYYVDGDHTDTSRMVIDKESWIFNLSDANIKGTSPYWYKLYSARSSYGMKGLRPTDWNKFVNDMDINDEIFDLYHKHYWRDSPKRPACDLKCKQNFICDARSGRSHDRNVLCRKTDRSSYQQQFVNLLSGVGQLLKSMTRFLTG